MESSNDDYWPALDRLIAESGMSPRALLANWPAHIRREDLPRFLSHYELFRQAVDLPGSIVELGVYYGAGLFTWAMLLDVFCPFDVSRRVYGFDSFRGLPVLSPEDGPPNRSAGKYEAAFRAPEAHVRRLLEIRNRDGAGRGEARAEIISGDVAESMPRFLAAHPGLRISLLHFDLDLYEPTKIALELLYPRVVKGGVVCFDEYGLEPWEGETRAVDEYFAKQAEPPTLRKHPFTLAPHGYFIK